MLASHRWPPHSAQLLAAIPALPVVRAAVIAALAVLAGTGRLARRLLTPSPRHTVRAAQAAAVLCLAADTAMLAQLASIALAAPTSHPAAAAAASLARLPCAGHAATWCHRSAVSLS